MAPISQGHCYQTLQGKSLLQFELPAQARYLGLLKQIMRLRRVAFIKRLCLYRNWRLSCNLIPMNFRAIRTTLKAGSLVFGASALFLLVLPKTFLELLGLDTSDVLVWSMRMIAITLVATGFDNNSTNITLVDDAED